jgi:hypothetical protein
LQIGGYKRVCGLQAARVLQCKDDRFFLDRTFQHGRPERCGLVDTCQNR